MDRNLCSLVSCHLNLPHQNAFILFTFFGLIFSLTRGAAGNSFTNSTKSTMALVPYSPPQTLLKFHESTRNFSFVGKTLTISQDWNEGGVAGVVWDAAVILCKYIEKHDYLVAKKNIIELGAGTGLVGMVAALLGGKLVVTDREMALKYINTNIDLNRKVLSQAVLKVEELTWGKDVVSFEPPFDVILGADIIYIEDTFQDLFQTLLDLSGTETLMLLSCRIRYERDNRFLDLLRTKFDVTKVFYDKETDIVIYKAKRLPSTSTRVDL